MRLVTFTDDRGTRIGTVEADRVTDLAEVAPALPTTMRGLLELGPPAMEAARRASAGRGGGLRLADVRLEAPIPDPGKFFAIALNYHLRDLPPGIDAAEAQRIRDGQAATKAANRQMWYNKQVTCITGPTDAIAPPADATELYFEAELAFVIGRTCRDVSVDEAPGCIAGYTICNDVTEGAWCRGSATLTFGKSFDTFGPLGPWIVTPDELGDPHDLAILGTVNGEVQQAGSTRDMIFDCYDLVSFASRRCTLRAGDVVTTGMPYCKLRTLAPGDLIRCEIEGIGHIENRIAAG